MARVLVVDDELDIREAVTEVLAYEGHEVITASEGAEALRKCRTFQPDLVLLDLMMPGMNGWDFRAAQLRDAELADIPVVVLSALGRVSSIDAVAFLPKPFGLDDLLDLVRRAARPGRDNGHAATL